MPQIIFDIDVKGKVKMEAEGYEGSSCEEALKVFEDALGGVVSERTFKPEHDQPVRESRRAPG